LHVQGKTSQITLSRIKELENMDFEWGSHGASWEDRMSELTDYRKIYGHCNVPHNYSENTKLANWVTNQRSHYRLQQEGKTSPMTLSRIKELESLGFEWGVYNTAWEDRLSELADYRKMHGHCNVPYRYSENTKLGKWISKQRSYYRL
jgi:predicted chitinase